jgi:hypothetical protein
MGSRSHPSAPLLASHSMIGSSGPPKPSGGTAILTRMGEPVVRLPERLVRGTHEAGPSFWRPEAESNRCTRICSLGAAISREISKSRCAKNFNLVCDTSLSRTIHAVLGFSAPDYTGITHKLAGRLMISEGHICCEGYGLQAASATALGKTGFSKIPPAASDRIGY